MRSHKIKVRLKLPNKLWTQFWDSPAYQQLLQSVLDNHQTAMHQYHVKEHEVTKMAGNTGVTAAEVHDIMRSMPGPPGPSGRDGRDGGQGLHGSQGPQGPPSTTP